MGFSIDNLRSLGGVAFVFAIAWALSDNRAKFPWRIVAVALGLEIVLAVSMFALPPLRALLAGVSAGIDGLQAATLEGARFVFGYLAGGATPYALTAPELQSRAVLLNGRRLELGLGDTLPALDPLPVNDRTVSLAPTSINFLTLPQAGNRSCA